MLACAQELIHGGEFCLQDCGLARQLLRTVVQQQQPCGEACLWLGQLSERGLGLPAPDYSDAAAWYGKGAELGHLECAQALAFYYEHGLGEELACRGRGPGVGQSRSPASTAVCGCSRHCRVAPSLHSFLGRIISTVPCVLPDLPQALSRTSKPPESGARLQLRVA